MKWPFSKLLKIQKPLPTPGSKTSMIMELLSNEYLSVSVISRRTGIHRMNVKGMVQALHDLGYIHSKPVPPSMLYRLNEDLYASNDEGI